MFGKIIAILMIIGLIALSTTLIIGFVKDIKTNRQRKKAKSEEKETSSK